MFKRRVATFDYDGRNTKEKWTSGLKGCPDVWQLENGDYAVIGIRSTSALKSRLPKEAACGPDEEIVVLPKAVFESCG